MAKLPHSVRDAFDGKRPRKARLRELRDNLEAVNDHITLLRMKRNQIRQEMLRIATDVEKTVLQADESLNPI